MSEPLSRMMASAASHGLPSSEAWIGPLRAVLGLLARFNARTNLVGDAADEAVIAEHFIETLALAALVGRVAGAPPARVIDVGAGAGLEVVLLGLCWPDTSFVAIEPRRRRAAFIEVAADAAGLGRRLEVIDRDLRGAHLSREFDLATSRATFSPDRWLHEARVLLRAGGLAAVHAAPGASVESRPPLGWSLAGAQDVPDRPDHRLTVFIAS